MPSSVVLWPTGDLRATEGSDPFVIILNFPIITGTIFVLTFQILLTSISRSSYLHNMSVFVLTFESSGMAILISRQVLYFFIMQYYTRSVC